MTDIATSRVRAVLFAGDLPSITNFYALAMGMARGESDANHAVVTCDGFELIIHQIPPHYAADKCGGKRPARNGAALRLDFPVSDIDASRRRARDLGGDIDAAPPPWAQAGTNFFHGTDPEGNVFGISEKRG